MTLQVRLIAAPEHTVSPAMPQLDQHALYELDILKQVEQSSTLSNRMVARKLGVSIKLAHELLKRMVRKGLLHVKVVNARRWDYFLTPKGIAEKTRLTVEFFDFSLHFYREARRRSAQVCRALSEAGRTRVAFLGANDLAEIVYLGVQEWGLMLAAVYDDACSGRRFMRVAVQPLSAFAADAYDAVLVCMYDARDPTGANFLPPGVRAASNMWWFFRKETSPVRRRNLRGHT